MKKILSKRIILIILATLLGILNIEDKDLKEETIEVINSDDKDDYKITAKDVLEEKKYFVPNLALVTYKEDGIMKKNVVEAIAAKKDIWIFSFITKKNRLLRITKDENGLNYKILYALEDAGNIDYFDLGFSNISLDMDLYKYSQKYTPLNEGVNIDKNTIMKIENNPLNTEINRSIVENIYGGWYELYGVYEFEFDYNENFYTYIFGLEGTKNNKKIYRSLTNPFMTIEEDLNSLKYELVIFDGEEKRIIINTKKITPSFTNQKLWYKSIMEYEKSFLEEKVLENQR